MSRTPLDFAPPPRRTGGENIVPMINVVFLLLIFFLMTATIRPPAPAEVTPPETVLGAERVPARETALWLDAAGGLYWGSLAGDAVLEALAAEGAPERVTIHADRDVEAAALARLLTRLAAAGVGETRLVVGRAPEGRR